MTDNPNTMRENVLYELETVEEYIKDIKNYDSDEDNIKKVRQALIDAKAYFEAMVESLDSVDMEHKEPYPDTDIIESD